MFGCSETSRQKDKEIKRMPRQTNLTQPEGTAICQLNFNSVADALEALLPHYRAVIALLVTSGEEADLVIEGFIEYLEPHEDFAGIPLHAELLDRHFISYFDELRGNDIHTVYLARSEDGTDIVARMPLADLMAILK